MLTPNINYKSLSQSYLFPEMKRRVNLFTSKYPNIHIYNLGEGDTTQPISQTVANAMVAHVEAMKNKKAFMGYGDPLGSINLRALIKDFYNDFINKPLDISEIFISDGAKADLFNLQTLFQGKMKVAVQSPSYPVYIDSLVINGNAGRLKGHSYENITYLIGNPENNFSPPLPNKKIDLFYLCYPNNPTGTTANREQLKEYVDYAIENKAIIIYDAVYSWFIQDSKIPQSIYEIPGANKCAIEVQSLSKLASFPSIRLGWTVVPNNLLAVKGQINAIWKRRQQTSFNGASIISQAGAIALFSKQGLEENKKHILYYMENTLLIKKTCQGLGLTCYGGENAPYVWIKTPNGMGSWDFFEMLLKKSHIICTPGVGFGESGDGFFRLSGFSTKEETSEALKEMVKLFS